MKAKILISTLILPLISACADMNNRGVVSYKSAVNADNVTTSDKVLKTTGRTLELTSTDCKMNLYSGKLPKSTVALEKLKLKAAQNGFDALHSVTVTSSGVGSLLSNCWSEIKATGIGYRK